MKKLFKEFSAQQTYYFAPPAIFSETPFLCRNKMSLISGSCRTNNKKGMEDDNSPRKIVPLPFFSHDKLSVFTLVRDMGTPHFVLTRTNRHGGKQLRRVKGFLILAVSFRIKPLSGPVPSKPILMTEISGGYKPSVEFVGSVLLFVI